MSKNEHEMPDLNMIIIKRGQPQEEHPHGGAWKVAFADFMTAMMAFFLVLWIVNSSNKETRSSVARYFNPIRISDTTPARKGLKDPKEVDFDAASGDDKPKAKIESGSSTEGQGGSAVGAGTQPMPGNVQAPASAFNAATASSVSSSLVDPSLARDPFVLLDEIAARAVGLPDVNDLILASAADGPGEGPQAFRDPFAPMAPVLPVKPAQVSARSDQRIAAKDQPRSGASQSVTSSAEQRESKDHEGLISKAALKDDPRDLSLQKAMAEAVILRDSISRALREAGLVQGPRLDVRAIDDGILISLTDDLDFGMFAVGSAEPQPRFVRAMEKIGSLLSAEAGNFIVRGHTDARPYRSRAYDNWRLSSARAQMTAYMLMRGKLDEKRIERIEGHADRSLRNQSDPLAAENRRIEILLRRPQ